MSKLLNVVVPMYNVAQYLPVSLQSIKDQTYTDFKCYLVNDGSKDNTREVALSLIEGDDRFVLLDKENGGLSDARNYGLEYVDSDYVYFFDSDDCLEKHCFQACIEAMQEKNLDMVLFDYVQVHQNNGFEETIENNYSADTVTDIVDNPDLLLTVANCAWNKMYKTSLFKTFDITYPKGYVYEDLGTTYRLLVHSHRVGFVRFPLYRYIVDRSGNITSDVNLKKLNQIIDMCELTVNYYKQQGLFNTYYEQLKALCGRNIIETLKKCNGIVYNNECDMFVDRCFDWLKGTFNDYPKCKYPLVYSKNGWIYQYRPVCKLYLKKRGKTNG